MAYFRKNQRTGEQTLVLTKRDRERRIVRRDRQSWYPIPKITAVRGRPGDRPERQWNMHDIQYFWWWNNYNGDEMAYAIEVAREHVAQAQVRNLITLKRERRRISNDYAWSRQATIRINGQEIRGEASPGYLALDRYTQAERIQNLKNMEMALRLWENPSLRRHITGRSFRPPYMRG